MASQGFSCRKDDGRGTVSSTPRVGLEAIVLVFDPTTPVQANTVVALLSLPFAIQTARFFFAAIPTLFVYPQHEGTGRRACLPFDFARFTWPTGGISNVGRGRNITLAYQQPVLLLFLGSGAPSFFGRGMVETPAWCWLEGKWCVYTLKETPSARTCCPWSWEKKRSSMIWIQGAALRPSQSG